MFFFLNGPFNQRAAFRLSFAFDEQEAVLWPLVFC